MKLSKRDREILARTVLIPPQRRGKIDPRLMRKALEALYERRRQEEAQAQAKAGAKRKAEANGHPDPVEAE